MFTASLHIAALITVSLLATRSFGASAVLQPKVSGEQIVAQVLALALDLVRSLPREGHLILWE